MTGHYPSTDFEIVDEGNIRKVRHLPAVIGRHADRDWPPTRDPSPAKSPPAGDETRRDCSVVARVSRPFTWRTNLGLG